jgi:hypothetical protein
MSIVKRLTVCKLIDHKWQRISYPPGRDGERSGMFLRCNRCGKEDYKAGTVPRGPGGGLAGGG